MYTSVLIIALSGLVALAVRDTPHWLTDYQTALKVGKEQSKPLAVFISSGKAGWNRLSQEGDLGPDINKILSGQYVCVYVNTAGIGGKQLASAFEVEIDTGLVISDRTGKHQAFHHQGDLANQDLAKYLKRFADPDRVVRATVTLDSERVSSYPAELSSASDSYQPPPMIYQSFGGGGGRSC